jgi:hypothetical protein
MLRYLSTAVAAGLMAGAVMAPAQAEEQEPLPVLPCVDFTAEFTDKMDSQIGTIVQQKSEGTVFTGTIEAEPEVFSNDGGVYPFLPPLRIGVPEPTEYVPSVYLDHWEGYDEPVLGCDYSNPVRINYTWLSRSDGFKAEVEEGANVSIPSWGCAEGADACRQMTMKPTSIPNSWMVFSPALTIEDYGQYVNVGEFLMTFDPDWTTQKQAKTTQVSYTVTVLPPSTVNELPEVPNEPAGISDGYDFGNVEIFDYKRGVTKINNIGTENLAIRKAKIVDVDGNDAPEFSVTGTNCKDGFIEPGRSCEVQVQFFPREQGARAAFINVATNSDYPLQIPLNGVGTYTKPESVEDAEQEAEANGTEPVYEVSEPEKVEVAGATTKNGKSVVKTKKKKIKVKWKAPDTDQPVTGYEIRSKFKKKSWKKWKDVDPMPNENGWIKASVKAKKSGNYKIQVTSSTPWVERGDKATVKIKKN